LTRLPVLDLEPRARALAGLIGAAELLRHKAFESKFATSFE
jgi:hypothetical protein